MNFLTGRPARAGRRARPIDEQPTRPPVGYAGPVSVTGLWSVAIQTPFGEQVVDLEFSDERTGTARYGTESIGLRDVTTAGDNASWTVALLEPVAVTLRCAVTVSGDTMSGTASAGFFGKFGLSGHRTAA